MFANIIEQGTISLLSGRTLSMTAIFWVFLPLPPSDCKMTSLLLYSMTSLLLTLTVIHQPPLPPRLPSYLMYGLFGEKKPSSELLWSKQYCTVKVSEYVQFWHRNVRLSANLFFTKKSCDCLRGLQINAKPVHIQELWQQGRLSLNFYSCRVKLLKRYFLHLLYARHLIWSDCKS